jgi:predicted enzyme related to lactoylglutathione lyase
MNSVARLGWIQIDCGDPVELVQFWSEVLGQPIEEDEDAEVPPRYMGLEAPPGHPRISFQRVPEGKVGKNRVHLDVLTDDLEDGTTRIVALGGSKIDEQPLLDLGYTYRRMRDPEGNEFCLIQDG